MSPREYYWYGTGFVMAFGGVIALLGLDPLLYVIWFAMGAANIGLAIAHGFRRRRSSENSKRGDS